MQAKKQNSLNMVYAGLMKTGRPAKSKRTSFGSRLHTYREAAGISQQQVADKLGITQPAYALWERRDVAIQPEQLLKLAKLLKVRVEDLFQDEKTNSRRGGPTGKARKLFEQVSQLPRSQQQHVLTVVEAFVEKKAVRS